MTPTDPSPPRAARRALSLAAALLAAALLLALAAPALAAPTRAFYTQNSGLTAPNAPVPGPFIAPWGIGIGAGDEVWISDPSKERGGVITRYDASGGYISQQTGAGRFGYSGTGIRSLALDRATGSLFVGDTNAGDGSKELINAFDNSGEFAGQFGESAGGGEVAVAVDNSGAASQGRVYMGSSVGRIRAFTAAGAEHPFEFTPPGNPGEYDYIAGNAITGTPAGPFGRLEGLATDPQGDVYVVDEASKAIEEFAPSGAFLQSVALPAGFAPNRGFAIDPTSGNFLLFGAEAGARVIDELDPAGALLGQITATPAGPLGLPFGLAVDSRGFLYAADNERHVVDEFLPAGVLIPEASAEAATELGRNTATLHATADPAGGGDITSCHFSFAAEADYKPWTADPYAAGPSTGAAPCLDAEGHEVGTPANPISTKKEVHAPIQIPPFEAPAAGSAIHWRISLANANAIPRNVPGPDFQNPPAVTELKTGAASELTQQSATLNGSFTGEEGLETHYFFEYGTSTNYAHKAPIPPAALPGPSSGTQTRDVATPISGLLAGTTYHYRILAEDKYGTSLGKDATFTTFQPPTIEGVSASHLSATSARLEARLDPQGLPSGVSAECSFEYGTTTAYDHTVPCPAQLSGTAPQQVAVEIAGLGGVTYHYRFLAESKWGTVASEDHSFEFFPPDCPNAAVRQQTGSNYLPDCRAYELVSPSNANGTLLFSGGPNTGYATSPSRLAFVGQFGSLAGAGEPIGGEGDLYLATRTASGWSSRYVGLPGDQTGCMGGPPEHPWSHASGPDKIQNFVLADPSMSRILDWNDGTGFSCGSEGNGSGDAAWSEDIASGAPYLWNADGSLVSQLPAGLASTPGAATAFACPVGGSQNVDRLCGGETTASGDLSHLFFSSNALSFAENELTHAPGLTRAPGSAYDYDLATGRIELISTLPGGQDIPQDPFFATVPLLPGEDRGGAEEFIRFPAVSTDGSHVLMSTATAPTPFCGKGGGTDATTGQPFCPRFTDTPLHLYMRVQQGGEGETLEIAEDPASHEPAPVTFIGMTPEGSKVYFTSRERLTPEDRDNSTDLYMWSQAGAAEGHPLTLLSKADNEGNPGEAGQSDACAAAPINPFREGEGGEEAPWTSKCGVLPYSGWAYADAAGNAGGNGRADSAIAANGDVYFYSPEQLDGDHGVPGQQNLYVYRQGRAQYVATLPPRRHCQPNGIRGRACTDGPIARLQVTPDDSHMAFLSAARLSSYDNAGHLEMYSYTPASGALVCDSCNPSGKPASADVAASQDGLFLTEDGRVFFSTAEALIPRDTNQASDVYEFVDGAPRLISAGTGGGASTSCHICAATRLEIPGLIGVSADGTDVYFSTFDSLVPEDRNGPFLKFYDARTDGGFARPTPAAPCAAAEECHGPGSEAPALPGQGSAATLSGGNAKPQPHPKHHKRKHKHKARKSKRHHGRAAQRGGGR